MNIYKQVMLLRYYNYSIKDAKRKIIINRVKYLVLYNLFSIMYNRTLDPYLKALSIYFLMEEVNSFANMETFSKEYIELKSIYKDIIEEYNKKISNTLEFNDPISVATSFSFAYQNGYLSKNKRFRYTTRLSDLIENRNILGASIFTGKGCCRHSSRLLSDILNDYGFESTHLVTGLNTVLGDIYYDTENYSRLEAALTKIVDTTGDRNITIEELDSILKPVTDLSKSFVSKWEHDRDNVPLNHSITGCIYNGHSYYIDPTNNEFYTKDEDTGRLINKDKNIENTIMSLSFESLKHKIVKRKLNKLTTYDLSDIYNTSVNTESLCYQNLDVFEQFYKDNHENYDELVKKLKNITM